MADITQEFEPDGCVTFTGVSDAGKAWLTEKCKESKVTFALEGSEKTEAERVLNLAKAAGLDVPDPPTKVS